MITGIIAALLVIISNVLMYLYVKKRLLNGMRSFFNAPNADTPSQFAETTGAIAQQFSQSMLNGFKATALGVARGEQKQSKAVDAALVKDAIAANNPLIGMLMQSMPQLNKLTNKNPELVAMAVQKLAGMSKGGGGNGSPAAPALTSVDLNNY